MQLARAALLALVSIAGVAQCGRLAEGGDGGPPEAGDSGEDAFVKCGQTPFGVPAPIAELNGPDGERDLRLTPDELTGIFERLVPVDSGPVPVPYLAPFLATRASATAAFSSVTRQWVGGFCGSLSADGLTVFFESQCGNEVPVRALCYCKRPSTQDVFGYYQPTKGIGDLGTQTGGFSENGLNWGDGYVTADTSAYYFVGPNPTDAGPYADADAGYSVFMSRRSTANDDAAMPEGFGKNTSLVLAPVDPSLFVDDPIVTSDELTLFLSTKSPNDPAPHIQTASRSSIHDAFGSLTPLHELDSAEGEYPTWISVDQCRLYMTRNVGGRWALYVASRLP